jgi:hypothetical protein
MNEEKAQSIVQIDENALDKECIRLPGDFLKYATRSADAKRNVDEAKAALDVTQAELGKKIRAMPEEFGLDKITEASLASTIILQQQFKGAQTVLFEARHEHDLIQAVVSAMDHKKRSLTLLVDLYGMSYFSSPKLSTEGREAVQEMTKRATRPRRGQEED